ncbi:MAG: hypothetical protein IK115_13770 [Lachnospiraceae bacterium]|nr:hypothetical protein [Lachnospiraceae bacterium]
MEREAYLQLMRRTDAAAAGFLALITRLERDGHIKTAKAPALSAVLLPELMAYSCALQRRQGRVAEEVLDLILPLLVAGESTEQIRGGILRRMEDFDKEESLPGAYLGLCRFDAMAQAYQGAFYSRMRTDNPGCLTEHYLALLEALWRLGGGSIKEEILLDAEEELRSKQKESLL